jgi:hypothetical protein
VGDTPSNHEEVTMPRPRRLFRNAHDPELQGDGWRWSLSFWLPWRLSLLVLTQAQRDACWAEWEATQQEFARRERELP